MPTRHQQAKGGKMQFMLQPDCQQVCMQVVDAKKGFAKAKGQPFGKGNANQQAAKQARATRRSHKINIRVALATCGSPFTAWGRYNKAAAAHARGLPQNYLPAWRA